MKLSSFVSRLLVFILILPIVSSYANEPDGITAWTVEGDKREDLIVPPAKKTDGLVPVILMFHGHGGSIKESIGQFDLQKYWPEAVIVYPQGMPTITGRDPEGKETGWQ